MVKSRFTFLVIASTFLIVSSAQLSEAWAQQESDPTSSETSPEISGETYTDQERRDLGLIVGGWSTFGGTHFVASLLQFLITGGDTWDGRWTHYIPLVGPAINGTIEGVNYGGDPIGRSMAVFGWLWTLIQGAGLTMAIVGHVRRNRARSGSARNHFQINVAACGPNGTAGVGLFGSF